MVCLEATPRVSFNYAGVPKVKLLSDELSRHLSLVVIQILLEHRLDFVKVLLSEHLSIIDNFNFLEKDREDFRFKNFCLWVVKMVEIFLIIVLRRS